MRGGGSMCEPRVVGSSDQIILWRGFAFQHSLLLAVYFTSSFTLLIHVTHES